MVFSLHFVSGSQLYADTRSTFKAAKFVTSRQTFLIHAKSLAMIILDENHIQDGYLQLSTENIR